MEDKGISVKAYKEHCHKNCKSPAAAHAGVCMEWVGGIRVLVSSIEIGGQCIPAEVDAAESVHCHADLAGVGIRQQAPESQAAQDRASYGERCPVRRV